MKFGAPKRIHSDKGTEFVNLVLNSITDLLHVGRSTTSGYDPQCNGLAERLNQTLLEMLKRSTPSTWDWDLCLLYFTFAYKVTPSLSTGFSPYTLVFGRIARFPIDANTFSNRSTLYR